jgi:hypothetical protein
MLLYLPVFWLILDRERYTGAAILSVSFFVLFGISVNYYKIRIYYDKNNGFLYLFLYLCALEIVPLLFFFESLTYLHKVIESSFL